MSAEAIFDTLGPVLARWTMGGSAINDAPAAWRDALGGDEAELRLLALSGQLLGTFVVPLPPADLRTLPEMPVLAMPVLPDALRALARRCVKALQASGMQADIAHLLAARGYTLHPADWIPSRHEANLPDVYAPLQDWVARQAGRRVGDDVLSEDNWLDFAPAARSIAFGALRRADPHAACVLLATKAARESADVRLQLIAGLAAGLSVADIPYLQSLASDHAPKVKACAEGLLARLGYGAADSADAPELAAFFTLQTKGLLRRSRVVTPVTLKTPAQRMRRHDLFGRADFARFARALGADDVVASWSFGTDEQADAGFRSMAARSAGDDVVAAIVARLTTASTLDVSALQQMRDRLGSEQRMHIAGLVLRSPDAVFCRARLFADAGAEMEGLIETRAGQALLAHAADADITVELQALAALASRSAAQAALDELTRVGLNLADPRLDLLRLNATLTRAGAAA